MPIEILFALLSDKPDSPDRDLVGECIIKSKRHAEANNPTY